MTPPNDRDEVTRGELAFYGICLAVGVIAIFIVRAMIL